MDLWIEEEKTCFSLVFPLVAHFCSFTLSDLCRTTIVTIATTTI